MSVDGLGGFGVVVGVAGGVGRALGGRLLLLLLLGGGTAPGGWGVLLLLLLAGAVGE